MANPFYYRPNSFAFETTNQRVLPTKKSTEEEEIVRRVQVYMCMNTYKYKKREDFAHTIHTKEAGWKGNNNDKKQ